MKNQLNKKLKPLPYLRFIPFSHQSQSKRLGDWSLFIYGANMATYIKLYRKFEKWEWYTDIKTKALFIHLLLIVNRFDGVWRGIPVKSGQRITSLNKLATETGLSIQNVRTSIKNLESTHDITYESTLKYSIITVLNYEKYQEDNTIANIQSTRESTRELTSVLTTNKKEKKVKKEKNNIKEYVQGSKEAVEHFFMFLTPRESERFEKERNSFLDIADKLLRIDKYTLNEIKNAVVFGKSDGFWSKNFQSFTKLRKKNNDGIYYIEVFLSKNKNISSKPNYNGELIKTEPDEEETTTMETF